MLLLDEPLGALDLKLRRQMQIELKRIQTDVGITFVHVTHDQEEAMTMADTIAVMNHGVIEQMGAPAELYENPRTTFVANFLGQSNLVASTVTSQSGDSVVVDCEGQRIEVEASRSHVEGGRAWLGVRPGEALRHACRQRATTPAATCSPGARSATSASWASASSTSCAMPWGQELMVFEQNTGRHTPLGYGDTVDLAWSPDHAFLLDAEQDAHAGHDDPGGRRVTGAAGVPPAAPDAAVDGESARRRGWGWLLLVPGMLWLAVFFLFPSVQLFFTSLYDPSGSYETGYAMTWHFANYVDAVRDNWNLFVRSFMYAGIATVDLPLAGLSVGLRHRVQVRPVEERDAGRW